MTFKMNLKNKMKIDKLFRRLVSTIREVPGNRRLNKVLARELLDMTDLKYEVVRDLHLYVRPLDGWIMEVVVFNNELPIFHTNVEDVALRRSPRRQELFSIKNIIKILVDKDVVASKGKESLKRIHAIALTMLDLTFNKHDLALLIEDARRGLERKSFSQIQESFDLFFELLDFLPVSVGEPALDLQVFAGPKGNGSADPAYEHLVFFDEYKLSLSLKEGDFSPRNDSDIDWVRRYSRGEQPADRDGIEVFEFLSELALERTRT